MQKIIVSLVILVVTLLSSYCGAEYHIMKNDAAHEQEIADLFVMEDKISFNNQVRLIQTNAIGYGQYINNLEVRDSWIYNYPVKWEPVLVHPSKGLFKSLVRQLDEQYYLHGDAARTIENVEWHHYNTTTGEMDEAFIKD